MICIKSLMSNIFFDYEKSENKEAAREVESRILRKKCVEEGIKRKAALASWLIPLSDLWV